MITKYSFMSLLAASVALAGCQKAKMSAVQPQVSPPPSTSYTAPTPPIPVATQPTPAPRIPEIDPGEPRPVVPPPTTVITTGGTEPVNPPVVPAIPAPTPTPAPPPTTTTTTVTPPPPPPPPTTTQVTYPQTPATAPIPEVRPVNTQVAAAVPVPTPRPAYTPTNGETCSENQPCKQIASMAGQCRSNSIDVTKVSKKLDILFVVDTSASLRLGPKNSREGGELPQIARQMQNFVMRLDPDTDYRISVALGHGPQSRYYGKLYSMGGSDPVYLDYAQIRAQEAARGGSASAIEARVQKRIWSNLEKKMLSVPDDKSDAQGEALMLNLYKLAHQPKLFRKGANIAVIAVTDEQDVCYAYPQKASLNNPEAFAQGLVPVLKPYRVKKGKTVYQPDVHETRFFNSKYCAQAVNGRRLQPQDVSDALRGLQAAVGGKVIMNAIAYKSNAGLKAMASNQDENEMAHGILDVVDTLKTGTVADLKDVDRNSSDGSFVNALTLLGDQTRFSMRYSSAFDCFSNVHPNAIDLGTLQLAIRDQNGGEVASYNAQNGGLRGDILPGKGGLPYLRVSVANTKAYVHQMNASNVESGTYNITFKTKAGVDPVSGKKVP